MQKDSSSLKVYIIKRLLQAIPLILGIIIFNFSLIHLAPGDPIIALIGEFQASKELIDDIKKQYGLDKPISTQLFIYVLNILKGDFGYSFAFKQPVINVIIDRIPATLLLMIVAIIFSSIFGVILGVISAKKQYSNTDNLITLISLIGYSLPVFWLGQMLLVSLSLRLPVFPAQGMTSLRESFTGIGYWGDVTHHLVLPAFTLGLRFLAINARFTRASMIEVMGQDYIRTAMAKGLSEKIVTYKHALRNALLPLITLTGVNFGFLLAGSVLTETVFAWPGLGRLMYDSIYARDYPVLMGMLIFISITVILVNLITDIFYSILDPRVKIS